MKKNSNYFKYALIFNVFLMILIIDVYAISMNQMPQESRIIIFEPNLEKEFSVYVFNSERIESIIYPGTLAEYVELIDNDQYGPPREIKMRLKLPATLEPGTYEVMFGGREYKNVEGTVGGLAAVASRVTILSLYEGKYPQFSVSANDIGIGETTNITISIENYGYEDIQYAYSIIQVYDPENNLVATLNTNAVNVPSKKKSLQPSISTAQFISKNYNLRPGIYTIKAKLIYDNSELPEEKTITFRVGTLTVNIVDWNKIIYSNVTNKFIIKIESDWAGEIKDVYAKVYTMDGTLKSPNLDIQKFETAELETYWDVKKTPLGNQTVTIEVFYEKKSTKKEVIVEVVPPIGPGVEKPTQISVLTIGIIVLVVLIVINIYLFLFRKKESKENNNIKPPYMPK
ncbi:MAG: hypothetical protein QXL18_04930 [Candidatus Woesearchaeota archaeon]